MAQRSSDDSAQDLADRTKPDTVAVLGIPSDENSSFLQGAALAPARIREALFSGASNLCAENGLDLGTDPCWQDLGDLELQPGLVALPTAESHGPHGPGSG